VTKWLDDQNNKHYYMNFKRDVNMIEDTN